MAKWWKIVSFANRRNMKSLKEGQEKIQEICHILRKETLEPAQLEASEIIQAAKERAKEIVEEAEMHAQKHLESVRRVIDQERNVFHASLEQAASQSLEALRQEVEKSLFNKEISKLVAMEAVKPDVIAKLISAIVKAIEKEGISSDISAIIPQTVSAEEVNRLLMDGILKKLKDESVKVGGFAGGAKVQMHDKKLTVDITDEALKELLTSYVRKDFRKIIFAANA